jgi:hypothetical protein
MRISKCKCGTQYYVRIPRQWWMRLFRARRLHYGCEGCGASLFIPPPATGWDPDATGKPRHVSELSRGMKG